MYKNRSYAVMAQQTTASKRNRNDFPTPPWATRALLEYIIECAVDLTCLEPACGKGHMAKVLKREFRKVYCSDIHDYGYGKVADFLKAKHKADSFDWVITNPPFKLAEEFILKSLPIARYGVAVLVRTTFLESVGRYQNLFKKYPPAKFAQFVERVPMVQGRLKKKASTATGYAWLVWEKSSNKHSRLMWLPPCRKRLEKDSDYQ